MKLLLNGISEEGLKFTCLNKQVLFQYSVTIFLQARKSKKYFLKHNFTNITTYVPKEIHCWCFLKASQN